MTNRAEGIFTQRARLAEVLLTTTACPTLDSKLNVVTLGKPSHLFADDESRAPEEVWVQALADGLSFEEAETLTQTVTKRRILSEGSFPGWFLEANQLKDQSWESPREWIRAEVSLHLEQQLKSLISNWRSRLSVAENDSHDLIRVGWVHGEVSKRPNEVSLSAYEVLRHFKISEFSSESPESEFDSFYFACDSVTYAWASRRIRGMLVRALDQSFDPEEVSQEALETTIRLLRDKGEALNGASFRKHLKIARCLEG